MRGISRKNGRIWEMIFGPFKTFGGGYHVTAYAFHFRFGPMTLSPKFMVA